MEKLHADQEGSGTIALRPAAADDQAFLLSVFASTRADELALLDWDENQKAAFNNMQFNAQSRQYLASYPHADNSIVLFNDEPVGRLLVARGAREFTLVDVALLPSHRGAGIGTYLIADLLREAAAAAKPVNLSVWHSNPAKVLYERLGSTVFLELRASSYFSFCVRPLCLCDGGGSFLAITHHKDTEKHKGRTEIKLQTRTLPNLA